jgi:D-alanyl-D-alanine carboxypeptidase
MPKTNLGLVAGDTITLKDAIMGVVIHSANDAAVVIAEAIGGNEDKFANLMTKRARALGMKNTTFKNASGLPHNEQKSTAYDLARLAIALRRDHPRHYPLFSETSFNYNGVTHESHNRVMRNYEHADGLKTGYIRASGFNLVTSAKKDDKKLVGVVLGGSTAAQRDRKMISLLDQYIHQEDFDEAPRKTKTVMAKKSVVVN